MRFIGYARHTWPSLSQPSFAARSFHSCQSRLSESAICSVCSMGPPGAIIRAAIERTCSALKAFDFDGVMSSFNVASGDHIVSLLILRGR
jgi:hypothetical protein